MKIVLTLTSAIMRNILKDIFAEQNEEVVFMTSSSQEALKFCLQNSVDVLILGENTFSFSDTQFFSQLKDASSLTEILFTGRWKNEEILSLEKLNFTKIIDYPSMEKIQDKFYQTELFNKFKKLFPALTRHNQNASHQEYTEKIEHIVIGSSTGGPKALKMILDNLPADFPVSISIVQHLEQGHEEGLVKYLDQESPLKIRTAVNEDKPKAGEVILALQGNHLVVKNKVFYYEDTQQVNFQKPAVDRLFETAANSFKKNLVGILLTGMGQDGANGCLKIIQNGGFTLVQDEKTSTVFGMPKKAIELNGASVILPLEKIADYLISIVKNRNQYGK
ncbi:MAG TPA: hypothetical protein DHW82_05030 [Spirochaetia bacterium]|nr:MAG: hypothetical protein A2Y41_11730 [Spirochaetes bacterium GWB1_36_13]HCL56356.1 hypothetical protein [Spirochaetia bacterium]